jgi:alcohol dehydrogenase, propanol-preferring
VRRASIDLDESKLVLAREVGADATVRPGERAAEEVRDSRGLRAEFVLDFVGSEATLALATVVSRVESELAIVGFAGGTLRVAVGRVPWETAVAIPTT